MKPLHQQQFNTIPSSEIDMQILDCEYELFLKIINETKRSSSATQAISTHSSYALSIRNPIQGWADEVLRQKIKGKL